MKVSLLVVPPLVFGLAGGITGAGFLAGCALALGYYNPVTAAIFGGSLGFGGTFYFGLLLWLDWIRPAPKPMPAQKPVQPEYRPTTPSGNVLRREPIESIRHDKMVKVAEKVRYGATISHSKLGSILTREEIGDLQTELISKNMALPRGRDHRGGIALLDKGFIALDSYLPSQSYKVYQISQSAYTHTHTHSNYVD